MRTVNLPIKWRLTLWYSGILALILIVFACGVYVYFENSLQRSIDTKIRSIGEVLSSSMTEERNTGIFANFERYLDRVLGKKPKGKLVQILDTSGRIGARMNDIEGQTFPTSYNTLERALKGETIYETLERVKPRLRVVTIPIFANNKVTSVVQVGTSLEDFDETMRKLLLIVVISIPTAIGVTIVGGYFMAKKALKPVDQIRRTAVKISSSYLDERIDVGKRRDELGRLAETFNAMIRRLKESFQRINQFSIDVSHELKTPLTILKGETEITLRKDRDSGEYKQLLMSNLEEIDRMTRIIDDLLLLSKADTNNVQLNIEDVALRDLVIGVCMDMKISAENKGVELEVKEIDDVRLKGDELKLRRMLWNIVENGIKYTPKGGTVTVSSYLNGNGSVHIGVRDNGIGISTDDVAYIFERFYRADRSRKRESGSGLGLSISKWIAEMHRGRIDVKSELTKGSVFTVELPIMDGGSE
jgi:heavy metal sensor kinase